MARINIEQDFFTSMRFQKLAEKVGRREAIGCVVELWHLAQLYWKRDKRLIPADIYELSDFPKEIEEVGLAIRKDDGVYARGSERHFAWLVQRVEAGRNGGKKGRSNEIKHLSKAAGSGVEAARSGSKPPTPPPTPTHIRTKVSCTLCNDVVSHLNKVCGTNYKPSSKATQRLIQARSAEGFTLADFQKVIEQKHKDWGTDPKMAQYLRPATLFSASKFEGYLQEVKPKSQALSVLHSLERRRMEKLK